MPRMDGPSLIREVRAIRPDLKVIFISGYAEEDFRKRLDRAARSTSSQALQPRPARREGERGHARPGGVRRQRRRVRRGARIGFSECEGRDRAASCCRTSAIELTRSWAIDAGAEARRWRRGSIVCSANRQPIVGASNSAPRAGCQHDGIGLEPPVARLDAVDLAACTMSPVTFAPASTRAPWRSAAEASARQSRPVFM